ncbi:MAG: hypothetical protein C5B52_04390 [Bacteroidetes bacterium]|nr:MAG: hypothetical protein C5B52_04390 [Bacteroidota bacterium]
MRLLISIGLLLIVANSQAQNLKGNWYGNADVLVDGSHNNYLVELDLRQKNINEIHGVISYYFKDSYQTFYVRGTYDPQSREIFIKNVPVTYFMATTKSGVECMMDLRATLTVSRVSSNLKGAFVTQDKYKYTCPDIAFDFVYGVQTRDLDSLIDNFAAARKIWKPSPEDIVVAKKIEEPKVEPKPLDTATLAAVATVDTTKLDTASVKMVAEKVDQNVKGVGVVQNDVKKIIAAYEKRKEVVTKELEVQSDSIRITLYDNGTIDGDSISVFYNKAPVATHQGLSERGINLYVELDSTKDVNEISMFAENLGKIPPNTALMVITDGVNRYEVFMSSSYSQNSSVRIRRKR